MGFKQLNKKRACVLCCFYVKMIMRDGAMLRKCLTNLECASFNSGLYFVHNITTIGRLVA